VIPPGSRPALFPPPPFCAAVRKELGLFPLLLSSSYRETDLVVNLFANAVLPFFSPFLFSLVIGEENFFFFFAEAVSVAVTSPFILYEGIMDGGGLSPLLSRY